MPLKTARRCQPSLPAKARPNNDLRRDSTPRRAKSNGDDDHPRAPRTSLLRALTASARPLDDSAVFFQRVMNPIFVVVVHIGSDQPVEMAFVQRDDRVEQLAPATADPALGDAGTAALFEDVVDLFQPSNGFRGG